MSSLKSCVLLACNYSLLAILLFLPAVMRITSGDNCSTPRYCGNSMDSPEIKFPFKLKGDIESERCGYQGLGFEVECAKEMIGKQILENQTLIYLPNDSGDQFQVMSIAYSNHKLWINDPHNCLPKHFLSHATLDLSGSPFELGVNMEVVNYTFLNCSNYQLDYVGTSGPIACLSNGNTSVVAMATEPDPAIDFLPIPVVVPADFSDECQVISTALVPFDKLGGSNLFDDIELVWTNPSCDYLHCDESKKTNYSLGLGLGITAATILFIAICYFIYCSTRRIVSNQQEAEMTELNNNNNLQAIIGGRSSVIMDIERYPKKEVEDDGGLPNPNDNVCSICLSEYQAKETLRIIPDCNHYFHAHCLHNWLKINASCPLCRKLPTPSLSSNSTSHSSSSLL